MIQSDMNTQLMQRPNECLRVEHTCCRCVFQSGATLRTMMPMPVSLPAGTPHKLPVLVQYYTTLPNAVSLANELLIS